MDLAESPAVIDRTGAFLQFLPFNKLAVFDEQLLLERNGPFIEIQIFFDENRLALEKKKKIIGAISGIGFLRDTDFARPEQGI